MTIRFDDRVAIVTGAGNGLGRCHALGLAARGAKVVVNDFGGARDGSGGSSEQAMKVVAEIEAAGGEAIADPADVTDVAAVTRMVEAALGKWGRVDILVNNAGILRDKSFGKMEPDDFHKVVDVHLNGAMNCTKAVWEPMRTQRYGRIVFTSSGSGLYGNFGQSNYGAAKTAMIGLMNVLVVEGEKYGIRVNCLAPTAATRMTEGLMSPEELERMQPEVITPGLLYLVSEDGPNRTIMAAGAGVFARTIIRESDGVYLAPANCTPEAVAKAFAVDEDLSGWHDIAGAFDQTRRFLNMAATAADNTRGQQ